MGERNVARDAMELLSRLIATAESEDWQNADSFVALTTDGETNAIFLNGPWEDPVEAMVWAEQHETALNKDAPVDEIPYVVRVFPMTRPQS